MENVNRWYFSKDELANTPSRKCGIDANKELSYRQQAANFIQDMGQRLQVTQLCINTAIVYMHRFYVFHSFSEVHRNSLSVAALFLAAKVEEQPRKLEHVIRVAHVCLHKDSPPLDVRTEAFAEKQFEVVAHENVLLQTLGFVLAIEHPHTYVVKVCQLVKASKDLAHKSYFMATTSLHMTTMCLQYRPTVVACVCIHLACKWSSWKIEPCSEGKEWYYYVDKSVTLDLLETLTQEFIAILETSPHKFKRCTKFSAHKDVSSHGLKPPGEFNFKQQTGESKLGSTKKDVFSPGPSTSFNLCSQTDEKVLPKFESCEKILSGSSLALQSEELPSKRNKSVSHSISIDTYREKKEKERNELEVSASKPQLSLIEPEKIIKDIEQSMQEKHVKSNVNAADHLTSSKNMVDDQQISPSKSSKKSSCLKNTSGVLSDPIVILERLDAKADKRPENFLSSSLEQLTKDNSYPLASVDVVRSKHSKLKVNSLHNSHSNPQPTSHKLSPKRDTIANGLKDSDLSEKRNNSDGRTELTKKEKHKSKHSFKDKSLVNHSNPSIKVKIRKDIIVLPEKSQKSCVENPKKSLKIKLPKPPSADSSTPIKLVITKDKSGSGSYCTSHKNESKKRTHSPTPQDTSKHARVEKATGQSGITMMQHLGNDSYGSLNTEAFGSRTFYNHHVYANSGMQRNKTDSNPPLPPFPPPQPPPPPT